MAKLTGGCVCGQVAFEVEDDFKHFFMCHCEQCRKFTGSAHASNLFTKPDNIKWLKGKDKIKSYVHPEREFSKVFCFECGSSLPFETKSGRFLLVPAGSLNEEPSKQPDAQIFIEEQTDWHRAGVSANQFSGFPK